jgi:hypothetical protein
MSRRSAGTSPSGSRTERANLRVETLISIWFMAHLPSQSSEIAASQLGRALRASIFNALVGIAVDVVRFPWRCFPFADSTPRAYRLKVSNAAPLFSTSAGTSASAMC